MLLTPPLNYIFVCNVDFILVCEKMECEARFKFTQYNDNAIFSFSSTGVYPPWLTCCEILLVQDFFLFDFFPHFNVRYDNGKNHHYPVIFLPGQPENRSDVYQRNTSSKIGFYSILNVSKRCVKWYPQNFIDSSTSSKIVRCGGGRVISSDCDSRWSDWEKRG